jgi:hypothetical protein
MFNRILFALTLAVSLFVWFFARRPLLSGAFFALSFWQLYAALSTGKAREPIILRLGGLAWTTSDFCRGWFVSGETGSGKTLGGINRLLWEVSQNCPTWGGICIDDKGLYWETLSAMFTQLGRRDDLTDKPHSLAFCVDFTLANYRKPRREKPLADAIAEYLIAKKHESERGIISEVQVGSIKKELTLLMAHFPKSSVAALTVAKLTGFCERGTPSLKTYNNRRGILSTFFKFSFQQDWVVANPVEKIPYHRIAHRRGSAKTLTLAQAKELMTFVETYEGGQLVPFFCVDGLVDGEDFAHLFSR